MSTFIFRSSLNCLLVFLSIFKTPSDSASFELSLARCVCRAAISWVSLGGVTTNVFSNFIVYLICGMSFVASPFGRWERSSSLVWATLSGACLAFIADFMFAIWRLRSYISCKFREKCACSLLCASEHSPILPVKLWQKERNWSSSNFYG